MDVKGTKGRDGSRERPAIGGGLANAETPRRSREGAVTPLLALVRRIVPCAEAVCPRMPAMQWLSQRRHVPQQG
eukprot:493469-Prymnesium_polylepis.1